MALFSENDEFILIMHSLSGSLMKKYRLMNGFYSQKELFLVSFTADYNHKHIQSSPKHIYYEAQIQFGNGCTPLY
jgi:hypothetical protein